MKTRYWIPALLVVLLVLSGGSASGQTDWIKYEANPVVSAPGPWYQGALSPCVLYNSDSSRFEMWFAGSAGALGERPCRVGYAVSADGVSWTVRSTPVLSPEAGKWDAFTVDAPYVIRENGQYKMWYTGTTDFLTARIGYATSPDGIEWTKHPGNPVFGTDPESWELVGAGYCCVMPSEGRYRMWYTSGSALGGKEYIGYAASADGIQWQRDTLNNPVLGPGGAGQWDVWYAALPRVLKVGDLHYMWYLGSTTSYSGFRGGLATSRDGVTNWVKYEGNPVLRPSQGQWDGEEVEIGSVLVVGDSLYLYYDGLGTRFRIGLAKCLFRPLAIAITATPQVVDFGQVLVGESSDTVEVQVKNVALHALTVNSVLVDGMAFSVSNVPSLPAVLAPSDSLAFGVFFHPAVHGNAYASVVVATSDSLQPAVRVALTGRGIQYGPELRQLVDRVTSASYPDRPGIVDSFFIEHPVMPFIERDSICQFLYRGNATTVSMAGDANEWSADASPMMRLSTTDAWILSELYERDARLEYKFVMNGTDWILDPRNPATCMGGFGSNSEFAMPSYVRAPELQYYPDIPHGELHDTSFSSSTLGNTRTIRVYTPPGYSQAGSDSFEVAVLHDGLDWLNFAEGDNALDYLIHHGRVRPLIAVFVPPVNRDAEYIGAQQDQFAAFISTEVMPYVDSRYRTQRRPKSRATAGISNGGNIALWIMAQYPQEFGNAASYSGAIQTTTASAFDVMPAHSWKVYLDVGTYEGSGFLELSRDFRDMLQARGYDYRYIEWHEGHSWGSWGAHLDNALEFFFPGIAVGVQEVHRMPTAFTLYQNYPNPFNPSTTIRYSLPERSHVSLTVFNTLGQKVATVVEGEMEAGVHEVKFDASRLASGVYLYRIQAGGFVQTRRLVVIR